MNENNGIKVSGLTPLRQDVFDIFRKANKPMTAYYVLEILRKKRPKAEPPTVYRVLEYLVKRQIIHRIESKNSYVCCTNPSHLTLSHQSILLFCKNCKTSFESEDNKIHSAIQDFVRKNKFQIDTPLIELQGICQKCYHL